MPQKLDTEKRRLVYNTYQTAQVIAIYTTARIFDLYGESWKITFDKTLKWKLVDMTATVMEDHGTFENWDVAEKFLHTMFPNLAD